MRKRAALMRKAAAWQRILWLLRLWTGLGCRYPPGEKCIILICASIRNMCADTVCFLSAIFFIFGKGNGFLYKKSFRKETADVSEYTEKSAVCYRQKDSFTIWASILWPVSVRWIPSVVMASNPISRILAFIGS